MKQLILIIFLIFSSTLFAQTGSEPMLLGKVKKSDLMKAPYKEWFDREYNNYEVNQDVLQQLKDANLKDYSITVFLGTWCSDSHREVPRLLKILEMAGIPENKIELIGLNTGEGVHKQSPTGEEKGKYIFKVPTFIISKDGEEVNRIVEYPVESLERDLSAIIFESYQSRKSSDFVIIYSPNYHSYPYIIDWLEKGILTDKNISVRGLAEQIKNKTKNAGELTSVAYVLMNQGKMQEAIALYKIADLFYPETINYYGYIETLYKNGEHDEAMSMLIKYLARSTDKKNIEWGLELYDKIKQK